MLAVACGGTDDAGLKGGGAAGSSSGGSTSGGSSSGGSSSGGSSSGGSTSGGSSSGGATGGSTSGGSASGGSTSGGSSSGGSSSGGSGGTPTCPGTAPGCVIDFAGQFGQTGSANGVGTAARFNGLSSITGDGTYLYVTVTNAVRKIEIATGTVSDFAGQQGMPGYKNLQGTAARFRFVDGIATDGTTVWVVDGGNNLIRAIDIATGDVTNVAGSPGMAGTTDGVGPAARFDATRGMFFDGAVLFVTETGGINAIRRINPATRRVTTIAGDNGTGNMDGSGSVAQFNRPRHLDGANGRLLVSDTENHLLRQIDLGNGGSQTNTVSTVVGSSSGSADGTGTAAQLDRHRGLDWDGSAFIVADSDNFTLRKVTVPGFVVTTIAGTAGNNTHAEGIGPAAGFDKPMDVHFDPGTGDLFIIEDNVVRRMYYK